MRYAVLATCLFVVLAGVAAAQTIERELAVRSGGEIEFDLDAGGTITVTGWNREAVALTADISGPDADIVTVSHYHADHSHVTPALGAPIVVDDTMEAHGVGFRARSTYHDREGGTRMGMTTMLAFELDGIRVAHLGDIGCEGAVRLHQQSCELFPPDAGDHVGATYRVPHGLGDGL